MLTAVVDAMMVPLAPLGPSGALAVVALLSALGILLLYKRLTDQERLGRSRGRMFGGVLEIALYRRDPVALWGSVGRVLGASLAYLGASAAPLLVAFLPMFFLLTQWNDWFDRRPLTQLQPALLTIHVRDSVDVLASRIDLKLPAGSRADSDAIRIPPTQEVVWRVVPGRQSRGEAVVTVDGLDYIKTFAAGDGFARVAVRRTGEGWWQHVLHPSEPAMDAHGPVASIRIDYPVREYALGSFRVGWLTAYLLLTLLWGALLMVPLRVRV